MAVKIEKKSKKKFIMCENCKCILSYENEDEKRLVDHWYIVCAACEDRIVTRDVDFNFYKEKLSDFIE